MKLGDALRMAQASDKRLKLSGPDDDTSKFDSTGTRKALRVNDKDKALMVFWAMHGFSFREITEELDNKFSFSTIVYHVHHYRPPGEIEFDMAAVRELFKRAGVELPDDLINKKD